MPIEISIYAVLLATVAPVLVAMGIFLTALDIWTDKKLRSDPVMQAQLQLVISEDCIAWTSVSDAAAFRRQPYGPLVYAALAGVVVAMIETAVFAYGSKVPPLWYRSGGVASAIVLVAPLAVATFFSSSLRRLVGRKFVKCANANLTFAIVTLTEIGRLSRLIDASYQSLGLQARTDIPSLCKQSLFGHAAYGTDAALAELIGVKNRLQYDLRNVQYCAHLFMSALAELEQVRESLKEDEAAQKQIEQIDNWIHSQDLANSLEGAQWAEAGEWLDAIRSDLRQLLDIVLRDCAIPRSIEDAYRVLNVAEDTPLSTIKAVVSAFQRVWHPDLAREESERWRRTLKMQQINVAWDLVQKEARQTGNAPEEE